MAGEDDREGAAEVQHGGCRRSKNRIRDVVTTTEGGIKIIGDAEEASEIALRGGIGVSDVFGGQMARFTSKLANKPLEECANLAL